MNWPAGYSGIWKWLHLRGDPLNLMQPNKTNRHYTVNKNIMSVADLEWC